MHPYLHLVNDAFLDDMLANHTLKLQVKKLISYAYALCMSDINIHHMLHVYTVLFVDRKLINHVLPYHVNQMFIKIIITAFLESTRAPVINKNLTKSRSMSFTVARTINFQFL